MNKAVNSLARSLQHVPLLRGYQKEAMFSEKRCAAAREGHQRCIAPRAASSPASHIIDCGTGALHLDAANADNMSAQKTVQGGEK